jgi:hypothetical protein
MTRLNGWQRLWIVLSAIYLLLIAGLTIVFWPTPETTGHREEFLTRMPADLRGKVDAAYSSTFQWEEAMKRATPPGTTPGFIPDPQPVTLPNGAVLQIRVTKKGDTEPDFRVADAYWAVVQSATRAARWQTAWAMALVWLVPCLTLYALGWAVAWVRRGFSRA